MHGPNYVVPPARAARVVSVHDLTFLHHPEFCTQPRPRVPRAPPPGARHRSVGPHRLGVRPRRGRGPPRRRPRAGGDRAAGGHAGAARPTPRRGRALAGGDRYVLAVGTVEPRKNLPASSRRSTSWPPSDPELRLVLAGPDGWGTDRARRGPGPARHGDRVVRARASCPRRTARDLLAGAAVVAVPSFYEGFGLTAAEAMLAGTPVVASDAGSHREVIGDAGMLVPGERPRRPRRRRSRGCSRDEALAADLRAPRARPGGRAHAGTAPPTAWSTCGAGRSPAPARPRLARDVHRLPSTERSMRALVTGALGFVGRHLVEHLRGERRRGRLRSTTTGPTRSTSPTPPRSARPSRTARPDAVYHLAGWADVGASWARPVERAAAQRRGHPPRPRGLPRRPACTGCCRWPAPTSTAS